MRYHVLLIALLAGPVAANESPGCKDVWFTRNLIMDRAGYCFGSALGKAVFDNSDCTGKDVALDAKSKALVSRLQKIERHFGCKVNTSRTRLDVNDVAIRRKLRTLPVFDEFESACLNWIGPARPLHAGTGTKTGVIGQIAPGDHVSFAHVPEGKWTYVTTYGKDRRLRSGGWTSNIAQSDCTDWAG